MIFDLTPCASCGHASAIHQVGSVCGAAHCYCRAFVTVDDDSRQRDFEREQYARSDREDSLDAA